MTHRSLAAMALALLLSACAAPATRTDALYRELGERDGISRLVSALLDRAYTDQRLAPLFADIERAPLAELIGDQFCAQAGGPCIYEGRPMDETHSGLAIKHAEFDAFVENFILAAEDVGLDYRTQNRMLRILAPMRVDIVDQ